MWCQFSNNFFVLFCSFSLPSICLQIVKHKLTFMTKMRGNGFFLLTGYYWSFSMCCQSWICQIAGLVWHVVHPSSSCELWGRSPADQSNICLKRHFNSDSDSIRDEQPGSKPNRSVCLSVRTVTRVWNLVCPWLLPQQLRNFIPGKKGSKKDLWIFCENNCTCLW